MTKPKKEILDVMSAWGGAITERLYELEEGGPSIYSEEPVDIVTFVTSPDWLGIEPQRHPDNPSIVAPSPLSESQLEFITTMTDFENHVVNAVLWVG